ncbi:unnamed protein product [Mytilus coruscus]|uniref:B box-type domain-containing protein n=1 Tax=Mytilus coruscus TaxID=42192 RepID=A0A6J8CBE8_MYTCO|nr:unnamed protein product [Mytilus coruscus]
MSCEIQSCHICDTPSSRLWICDACLHQCCQICIDKHKTDKICQLITEHVNNVSNVCKHHNGRVYTGYCLKCSKQTCEKCDHSHADHLTSIMTLKLAMEPIQKRLRSCKTLFSQTGKDTENLIHSSTEEIKKLRNVRNEIKDGGMKWERLISDIKDEFLKQVSSHISKLEEFCDKGYDQQSLMNEMINKVDSLENVQYIWTFYPIWLAVIDELESVVALEKIPKCGSFSIILQNTLPDLSDCLIETREYTDLMREKELQLDSDALKLGNEIEKSKLATKDLEKRIQENELLKSDICKLQGQLAESKLLSDVCAVEQNEMYKSVRDLYESIFTQRSEKSAEMTTSLNNLTTIPLMVEYIRSQTSELKSRNYQTLLVENERLLTTIKNLEKQKIEPRESLGYINHQTILAENEHLHSQIEILEKQKKEMKESLGNHETMLVENERMLTKIEALEKQKTEMKESLGSHQTMIDENERMRTKIEALEKQKTEMKESLSSYKNHNAEKEKLEEELRRIKNKGEEEGAFIEDKSEILSSLNFLHASVIQLQTREGLAHDRPNIATDTKSALTVIDFVLKHMFEMNEKIIKLDGDLIDEKAKQTNLSNKSTDASEAAKTNIAMFSHELHESKNKELEQLKIDNVTLKQKIKDLEANQTTNESTSSAEAAKTKITKNEIELQSKNLDLEQLKQSNITLEQKIKDLEKANIEIEEQYQKLCKERDELKNRVEYIEPQLNEKKKEVGNMLVAVENLKFSLLEKGNEIAEIRQDRDNRIRSVQQLYSQLDKRNSELQRIGEQQKELSKSKEEAITALRKEKDDLQTRLSSVAGEKLTKGNPSITDLGDPNRPMKISEKYGELYDNEWTDAMDNNQAVKEYYHGLNDSEIEEIIICHLHRLLKCCYKDCLAKADEQIQTLGKAFAETMCLTFNSKEELISLPVCKEASVFRRAKSVDFAKFLFENQILCSNVMNDWNYNYKNEKVMQLLMTSSFFEKCVHICWSMAIQDPVMYLDEDVPADTQIDKNTYKEFVKSGNTVAFVVWPALFLHKDGPLLYKGVVQAYWK